MTIDVTAHVVNMFIHIETEKNVLWNVRKQSFDI